MTDIKPARDRSGTLIFFGFFLTLSGFLSLLLILVLVLGTLAGQITGAAPFTASTFISMLFYFILSILFMGLGLGSIFKKRWAVALIIALHWLWLGIGVLSFIFLITMVPVMARALFGPNADASVVSLLMTLYALLGGLLLIVHPIVFITVYQNRYIRETVNFYDPNPGRIESCPKPVLILCLLILNGVLTLLSTGAVHWTVPFFGTLVKGGTGALIILISAMICLYLTYEIFLLKRRALLILAALILIATASFTLTSLRYDYFDFVQMMNLSEDPRTMMVMETMIPYFNRVLPVWVLVSALVTLIYMLAIKRYFTEEKRVLPAGQ